MENAVIRYMEGDTSFEIQVAAVQETKLYRNQHPEIKDDRQAMKAIYAERRDAEVRAYERDNPPPSMSREEASIEIGNCAIALARAEGVPSNPSHTKKALATNPGIAHAYLGYPLDPEFIRKYAVPLEKKARRYDAAARLNQVIVALMGVGFSLTEAATNAMQNFPDVIKQAAADWLENMTTRKAGENPPYGMLTEENLRAARREVERENPLVAAARDAGVLTPTSLVVLIPKLEQIARAIGDSG